MYRDLQDYIIPRIGDVLMSGAEQMHMFHLPMLRSKRFQPLSEYRVIKRILDIICSLLAIVFFGWLYLIIAILVRIKLGKPVKGLVLDNISTTVTS